MMDSSSDCEEIEEIPLPQPPPPFALLALLEEVGHHQDHEEPTTPDTPPTPPHSPLLLLPQPMPPPQRLWHKTDELSCNLDLHLGELLLDLYLASPEPYSPPLTLGEDNQQTRDYNYFMFDAFEPQPVVVVPPRKNRASQRLRHQERRHRTAEEDCDILVD
jgi:hypothetical protein